MALLTKQQILEANDLKTEDIDVPEWGGTVRVRCLTAAHRDAWEMEMFGVSGSERNMSNARAKLVARCVVDENGNDMFTKEDVEVLGNKSAAALDRVFAACRRINGIGKEDLEEMVGNSKGGLSEGSISA